MIKFYNSKSPSKGIDLNSSKSSQLSIIQPQTLHISSSNLSAESYFIPVESIPNRKLQEKIIPHFLTNSLAYLNFPPKNRNSVPSESSKHQKYPSKPYKFRSSTHPKFRAKATKLRLKMQDLNSKPSNCGSKITQISPATLQVLTQVCKLGPCPDIITYTTFIKFLGDSGHVAEASELFALMKRVHEPDVISFTILIQILCSYGKLDEALDLLLEMPYYNCKPDIFCYNILFNKLGEANCEEIVLKLWWQMRSDDILPDLVTYSSLVKMLCRADKIGEAILALGLMERSATIEPNTYVYNTIIKAHLDQEKIKEALKILERMENHGCNPDLCSFNLFIKYFRDLGEGSKAYEFLKEMIRRGIEPTESSYWTCAFGLIEEGKVTDAIELIENVRSSCVLLSVCTWNKLILWLGKMGRLDEAYRAFLDMKSPDEVTINIVIHMFYKHNRGENAWEVFNLMKEMKVKASVVTYNCLLDGLCKAGEVDDACELVLEMIKEECRPDLITYNTVINGLIGVGRTEDACKLFENMRGKLSTYTVPMETIIMQMVEKRYFDSCD